ncbi:MAG: STAS domain-containing protein [Acidobacteria bacterium]|nr:STAS domain-containing protein [Acidobacteriota bacterium]
MSLQLVRRERDGVAIFELKGRLVVGPSTTQFRDAVEQSIERGESKIIVNLRDIEYIDSTGLGALVLCFTKAKKAGGGMKLVGLQKRDLELLVLTKLTTVFDVYAEEDDAFNSFFPDREIKRFDILAFVKSHRDDDDY